MRSKFLLMKTLNNIKTSTKDLEYYINLVDRGMAGFERIDFTFKISSGDKMIKLYQLLHKNTL